MEIKKLPKKGESGRLIEINRETTPNLLDRVTKNL